MFSVWLFVMVTVKLLAYLSCDKKIKFLILFFFISHFPGIHEWIEPGWKRVCWRLPQYFRLASCCRDCVQVHRSHSEGKTWDFSLYRTILLPLAFIQKSHLVDREKCDGCSIFPVCLYIHVHAILKVKIDFYLSVLAKSLQNLQHLKWEIL